jgi:hypothetical protein
MTVESLSVLDLNVNYRQAIMPNHQSGSFTGDDTDNHDFVFQGRGKSTVAISIDNAPNKELTWTLYGMHEADGEVGDAGTFQVDTGAIALASKSDEGFIGWNYPYYLLRCAYAVAPDDDPKKTVSVYVDISS